MRANLMLRNQSKCQKYFLSIADLTPIFLDFNLGYTELIVFVFTFSSYGHRGNFNAGSVKGCLGLASHLLRAAMNSGDGLSLDLLTSVAVAVPLLGLSHFQ